MQDAPNLRYFVLESGENGVVEFLVEVIVDNISETLGQDQVHHVNAPESDCLIGVVAELRVVVGVGVKLCSLRG